MFFVRHNSPYTLHDPGGTCRTSVYDKLTKRRSARIFPKNLDFFLSDPSEILKKRQHLLRIESSAGDFEDLVRSARSNGHRVGRLILDDPPRIPELEDPSFLRTVAVGGGRSVAVKSILGPPVLRDLLREHFAGCRLVLIAGEIEAPLLRRSESGWKIEAEGRILTWTTEELVAALSRPQLFAS